MKWEGQLRRGSFKPVSPPDSFAAHMRMRAAHSFLGQEKTTTMMIMMMMMTQRDAVVTAARVERRCWGCYCSNCYCDHPQSPQSSTLNECDSRSLREMHTEGGRGTLSYNNHCCRHRLWLFFASSWFCFLCSCFTHRLHHLPP